MKRIKPPDDLNEAEFMACARHWYECKGCDLCNPMRERVKAEDQRAVAIVNHFVRTFAKRPKG